MKPRNNEPTVLDVIDAALGVDATEKVDTLSLDQIAEFADQVDKFYRVKSGSTNGDAIYSGGWIAGNWLNPDTFNYLLVSSLYYPQAIIHDPLAAWSFRRAAALKAPPELRAVNGMRFDGGDVFRLASSTFAYGDLVRARQDLRGLIEQILRLRPLVEAGVLVPVSPWHIVLQNQEPILTAMRFDSKDGRLAELIGEDPSNVARGDAIRGLQVEPHGGFIPSDRLRAVVQDPSYYFHKTTAVAAATNAVYVPPEIMDARILKYQLAKSAPALRKASMDLKLVPALMAADLPWLQDLDVKTVIDVRANESSFEDWRSKLRSVTRSIELMPSDGANFQAEASVIFRDELDPIARQVAKSVSGSSHLKRIGTSGTISAGVGAIASLTGPILTGTPLNAAGLAGVGISGSLSFLIAAMFQRPRPDKQPGANAVIAQLIRRK